jgi:hypothetical protein
MGGRYCFALPGIELGEAAGNIPLIKDKFVVEFKIGQ